jgi:hypothetical protein
LKLIFRNKEVELLLSKMKATVVMIEGVEHYPHAEMPEKTIAAILPFLDKTKEKVLNGN